MMSFAEWRMWLKSLPWVFKWFTWLVILRPIIDNFYFLKEISPLLSPLYIVGVLTPVMLIFSFVSPSFRSKYRSPIGDVLFGLWGSLVFINAFAIFLSEASLDLFGDVIRLTTPVMLFFYLRHMISSRKDLNGVLQAFLIGCIFPAVIFIYEQIFGAIAPDYLSSGRGGGARIQGAYADIMSYAIYIVGSFLVVSYFFIRKLELGIVTRRDFWFLGIVLFIDILGLMAIKQVSTYSVMAVLIALMLFYLFRNRRTTVLVLLTLPIIVIVSLKIYESSLGQMVDKEIRVIEGESDVNRSFNGRMTRWNKYFDLWAEMPGYSVYFGAPTSGFKEARIMIGGGMHSDYVRNLFLTGIVGLIIYMLFLLSMFIKSLLLNTYDRYLALASLMALLLHSVSTTPLLYVSYFYLLLVIFSFILLPINRINEQA